MIYNSLKYRIFSIIYNRKLGKVEAEFLSYYPTGLTCEGLDFEGWCCHHPEHFSWFLTSPILPS